MAVDNYVVALGDNELMFVTQRVGCVADQFEQPIATGLDVCTVLYVVRRPELLSASVAPLVKQGVEGVEHQRFVFLLYRLIHNSFSSLCDLIDSVGIERDISFNLRDGGIRVLVRPHRIDGLLASSRNAVVTA